MSSNVNDSTFSNSGKTNSDTHEGYKDHPELMIDASASKKPLILHASEKTFSPEETGLKNSKAKEEEEDDKKLLSAA
jgi:hypothetical protein